MRFIRPLLLMALLVPALPARAADPAPPPKHDRIYLLGTEEDFLYWSVDRHDPELGSARVERSCSSARPKGTPGFKPCSFFFLPATHLYEPAAWNASVPLRFHLALEVETPGAFTVHLNVRGAESPAAVQVAPGIWEGTLTAGSPLPASTWSTMSVVVKRDVPHATISLRAAGASYIDLPQLVPSTGVPALLAQSPGPKGGGLRTFETELRSFTFLDDEYRVTALQGDLMQTRTFDITVDSDALFVLAWVELFRTPFAHDVVRGRDPDSRKLTDSARADLLRDGALVARGTNPGLYGLGTETVLAMDVPAGPLSLQITPNEVFPTDFQQGSPYRAFVLSVHGDRTLSAMRWTSMFAEYPGLGPTQAPFFARCPGTPPEVVPMTAEVTSVSFDMDVDSVSPLDPNWTLGFLLPPNSWFLCGEVSTGDSLRHTFPFTGIHRVGAMVAQDTTYTEWRDTVFEFEARYAYTPPPPPDDDGLD